jgi:hypothetical protein
MNEHYLALIVEMLEVQNRLLGELLEKLAPPTYDVKVDGGRLIPLPSIKEIE